MSVTNTRITNMTKKKTYKMPPPAENEAGEPAIAYGRMNTLKQEVIDYIMQLNDMEALERLMKYTRRQKKVVEEKTTSKEEILAGIERAVIELKLIQEGKKKGKDINEFLNEI